MRVYYMRRIVSKRSEKSKERFNKLLVGLVLMGLMLMSVLGYSLRGRAGDNADKEPSITYNGIEFINRSGFWVTEMQDLQFVFRNNPHEVPRINSTLNYIDMYSNRPLYIDSESEEATTEIYTNLNPLVQRMQNACLANTTCEEDLPFKDCNNNLIIIQESNITNIEQNQSCVFIQGSQEDLVKLTDEFLFKIFGIDD